MRPTGSMRRKHPWLAALVLAAVTVCPALALAAPSEPELPAGAEADAWHKTPAGVYVPGAQLTIRQQIKTADALIVPGKAPKDPPKIVTSLGESAQPGANLVLPHPPGDPKQLVVVAGSGSRASIAQALVARGAFEEARAVGGAAPGGGWQRAVPASMVSEAREIMPPGADRVVKGFVPAGAPKDTAERIARVKADEDGALAPGKLVTPRREGQGPVKDEAANKAYDYSGTVYAFYKAVLGRKSIDDKGMRLTSVVHQQELDDDGNLQRMNNAYYSGGTMRYGDGDGKRYRTRIRLETAGHELTHGVTDRTADLEYKGQSGALNEHFSDVLGTSIRQWKQGVTVDRADWRYGTDAPALTAPASVKAIRSMSDPPSIGQPGHMKDFEVTTSDNGGVHTNSGIPNRAFYGAAMRIGGYVWDKSLKIWYVALRDYLGPKATIPEAARATAYVAGQLYGVGSREQAAVIAGWADVGVHVGEGAHVPRLRSGPPN